MGVARMDQATNPSLRRVAFRRPSPLPRRPRGGLIFHVDQPLQVARQIKRLLLRHLQHLAPRQRRLLQRHAVGLQAFVVAAREG